MGSDGQGGAPAYAGKLQTGQRWLMKFTITVHHGPSFLLVVASGRAMVCDIMGAIDLVGTISAVHGDTKALLDLMSVEDVLTESEHMAASHHAERAWLHLERVATALAHSQTPERQIAGGSNAQTFHTLPDAIAWLTAP